MGTLRKVPNDPKDLSKVTTYQSGVIQSAAFRSLKAHTDECLKEHNLTTMQWFIVGTVYDARATGIRLTDLAKKIDTTLAFLTNTVNLLESRKILMRIENASDNRSKMITVTSSFRRQCPKIEADLRMKLRKSIYSKITPEDLSVYIRVLYKLTELE